MSDTLYDKLPHCIQNIAVTFFDINKNIIRRKGFYKKHKYLHIKLYYATLSEITDFQNQSFLDFVDYAKKYSEYYGNRLKSISINSVSDISKIPILEKETLRTDIEKIRTVPVNKGIAAFTGGTTGKPLRVIYTKKDIQERIAVLDIFREFHGYKFGNSKIAWFSGRKILNAKDERKNRFWKTDYLFKIRYYSTFHLSYKNMRYYIDNLNQFKPSYISGFPSAIFELSQYIYKNKIPLKYHLKGIFTTSETLSLHYRECIESAFQCKVYNQYASAEGAPFITECSAGNLHYNMATGIIEVVDDTMKSCAEGEILVTSFATHGVPLIRYRIGDYIKLKSDKCSCGCEYPLVEYIEGRKTDFIYSAERGKIFNSQVGDCVKADFAGVVNFQVIQNSIDAIDIALVTDNVYVPEIEKKIIDKFRIRLGDAIKININYVSEIKKEESGKYRMIINNIKGCV